MKLMHPKRLNMSLKNEMGRLIQLCVFDCTATLPPKRKWSYYFLNSQSFIVFAVKILSSFKTQNFFYSHSGSKSIIKNQYSIRVSGYQNWPPFFFLLIRNLLHQIVLSLQESPFLLQCLPSNLSCNNRFFLNTTILITYTKLINKFY